MNRGYIRLWRKSLDNDLIRNPNAWQLMSWCLLKATHKPHKQIVGASIVELSPGQLIFGRASVARELGLTERKIRTSLELLKKVDFLTIKTTNKYSVITIVNWNTYQEERPANDQPGDQKATSKRPTNDHKQTHNTETHNTEEEKNPPISPRGDGGDFDRFWAAYPGHRKTRKPETQKKFEQLRKSGKLPPIDELLAILARHARSPGWLKQNGEFIPGPLPWLNQSRWLDDIATIPVYKPPPGLPPVDPDDYDPVSSF